ELEDDGGGLVQIMHPIRAGLINDIAVGNLVDVEALGSDKQFRHRHFTPVSQCASIAARRREAKRPAAKSRLTLARARAASRDASPPSVRSLAQEVAKSSSLSANRSSCPERRPVPSAPNRVATTGTPYFALSRSLMRVPPPALIGTTASAARR